MPPRKRKSKGPDKGLNVFVLGWKTRDCDFIIAVEKSGWFGQKEKNIQCNRFANNLVISGDLPIEHSGIRILCDEHAQKIRDSRCLVKLYAATEEKK